MASLCPRCRRKLPPGRAADQTALCPDCGQHLSPDDACGNEGGPSTGKTVSAPASAEPRTWSDGQPTEVGSAPSTGQPSGVESPRVPGYEILKVLGRGGMGVVYLARQHGLNRLVALKMILTGAHAGEERLARFRAEGIAAARLHHPNIVQVHDVGEADGHPYFSLEYVAGGNLARLLSGKPQPPTEAARLIRTLALAMQYAHEQGIVHRDLKPANVLLQIADLRLQSDRPNPASQSAIYDLKSAIPKVTDFGLAKQLDSDGGLTGSGAILGTPNYMAPEQAAGDVHGLGPAVDVYALGAILYEALAGRPPFRGASVLETLEQVRSLEPVPPSWLEARVPKDLETICLKCLQKAPGKRYAGAGDLAEDLRRFLDREPILARPVGRAERGLRWCRRNPVVAGLTAAVAVVLLTGTVVSLYFAAQAARRAAEAHAVLAESEANLYVARMNLAQVDWENANVARIDELLEPYRHPPAGKHDLRGWEWYYQEALRQAGLRTLHGHTGPVTSVAFSLDGSRLASASGDVGGDGTVRVWDAATGRALYVLRGHADSVRAVAWSRDGRRLASGGWDHVIKIWDADTGQELATLRGHGDGIFCVAFSPDGRRLASGSADHTVRLWDPAAGRELTILQGHADWVRTIAFNPTGDRLAAGTEGGNITIWDPADGRAVKTLRGHAGSVGGLAFTPAGDRLASASWDQTIKIWNPADGRELQVLRGHTAGVVSLAFSPDGGRLASGSWDHTVRVWNPTDGHELLKLVGHAGWVWDIAFSPDGSRLASASHDHTIKIWNAAVPPGGRIEEKTAAIWSVAFSPDGRRLATGSMDGTVRLWDAASRQELRVLRGHHGEALGVAFHPDGRTLASGGADGTVRLWDTADGRLLNTFTGHTDWVFGVAFSPDGTRLATASQDRTVKVWDPAGGRALLTLRGHGDRVLSVAFDRTGRRLASGSTDESVKLWDAADGRELATLRGHTAGVRCVAFSPDGARLASGSRDRTIKVWDLAGGSQPRTCMGHKGPVAGVAFTPDGSRLASASWDQTVKLWDPASGQELRTLKGHADAVWCVAFHPAGDRLASAGQDRTIQIWDARPRTPELRRHAEALALVEYLADNAALREGVVDKLRADKGIAEEVRREALALLEGYWPRRQAPAGGR